MNIDVLKEAWQAQDPPHAPAAGQGGEMTMLLDKVDALERTIRRRDLREYVTACFVIAFFGWRAAVTPDALVRLGAAVVVLGAMFIIVWSRRAATPRRHPAFDSDLPVAQFCARELERVEAQLRLSRSVAWWYVAPTVTGLLIMTNAGPASPAYKVVASAAFLAVGWLIHWMNQSAAETELEPLRAHLGSVLAELRGGTTDWPN